MKINSVISNTIGRRAIINVSIVKVGSPPRDATISLLTLYAVSPNPTGSTAAQMLDKSTAGFNSRLGEISAFSATLKQTGIKVAIVEEVLLNIVKNMDNRPHPITARRSLLPSGTIRPASFVNNDVLARPADRTNILANRIAVVLANPLQASLALKIPDTSKTTITLTATAG